MALVVPRGDQIRELVLKLLLELILILGKHGLVYQVLLLTLLPSVKPWRGAAWEHASQRVRGHSRRLHFD